MKNLTQNFPITKCQKIRVITLEVIKTVIVRTCKEFKCDNGIIIQYDDNIAIVIDQEGNPKKTRIFGAIARELRRLNFIKIVSLAPEVS